MNSSTAATLIMITICSIMPKDVQARFHSLEGESIEDVSWTTPVESVPFIHKLAFNVTSCSLDMGGPTERSDRKGSRPTGANLKGRGRKRPRRSEERSNSRAQKGDKFLIEIEDEQIDSDEEEQAFQKGKRLEKELEEKKKNGVNVVTKDHNHEPSDDDFFESPEEKRVKLAKKLLDRIGMGAKNDKEIAEALALEANTSGKKVSYKIADRVGERHIEVYNNYH